MSEREAAPHLLVIDPSFEHAELQGVEQVLKHWEGSARVLRPALREGDGPGPEDGYEGIDGVVILGSASSVKDPHPWLLALRAWLGPLLAGELARPVLGVCFGHQLIASLAGAEVGYMHADHTKRLAVETSRFEASRLLGEPTTLRVISSHRECVCARPEGYRVIATRPGVSFDGFEHEALPIHTVQFHPEARDQFMKRVGLDLNALDEALDRDGQRVLRGFHEVVRRHDAQG